MAKVTESGNPRQFRPPLTPESDEQQAIAMAMSLVKQRLADGTASAQETVHFLKLATTKSRLENQLLEAQTEVTIAKKEALQSQAELKELYADALKAMRNYSGQGDPDEY